MKRLVLWAALAALPLVAAGVSVSQLDGGCGDCDCCSCCVTERCGCEHCGCECCSDEGCPGA